MEGIIAAILMTILFSSTAPIWKELRNKGVSPKAILAISGFTFPAWIVAGIIITRWYDFQISPLYFLVVVGWVALVIFRHRITLYLFKYKALTEMGAYGLAFSLFASLFIDIFFFQVSFALQSIIAFILFLFAGLLISSNRKIELGKSKISTQKTILILAISAFSVSAFFAIYKVGIQMQEHVLLHVALSQLLLSIALFIMGFDDLKKYIEQKKIKRKHIFLANTFIILGVFAEGYALGELPISIVILMALLPVFIFAFFDLKKKEVTITKQTIAAAAIIVIAAILLAL